MGPAGRALVASLRVPRRLPRSFLFLVGVSAAVTLFTVVGGVIPVLGGLLDAFVVKPVLLAGLIAASSAALDRAEPDTAARATDEPPVAAFKSGVRRYWGSLAGSFFVVAITSVALVIGVVVLLIALLVAASIAGTEGTDPGTVISVALVLGAIGTVLLVAMIAQFVDVAIVLGGAGPFEAFRVAGRLIVRNPVAVVGFSLIRFGMLLVTVVLGAGAVSLFDPTLQAIGAPQGSLTWNAAAAVAAGVPLLGCWSAALAAGYVYHAAFFRLTATPAVLPDGVVAASHDPAVRRGEDASAEPEETRDRWTERDEWGTLRDRERDE